MSLGVAQDEAQLRLRTPICRPRTFKKEGQNMDQKNDMTNDDEGAKMGPKKGTKNHKQKGSKTNLNIISLSFGSLGLSRAEVLPFRRNRRRNRRRRRNPKYVQKRKGGDIAVIAYNYPYIVCMGSWK